LLLLSVTLICASVKGINSTVQLKLVPACSPKFSRGAPVELLPGMTSRR
jgi:hypothetical protein